MPGPTHTHTHKKKQTKKKRKKKKKIFIMVTMAYFTIGLSACLYLIITIYFICAVFVSLISFVFVSFFFLSFGHSFLFSFLDRNIYLRGASSIGTLRRETFSLDMEKGSKSQTLVWCENCTEKFTKSRGRRNCQSNGWLLNLFSNRFSLLRAMCKYFFLVLTELSYSLRVSNKY